MATNAVIDLPLEATQVDRLGRNAAATGFVPRRDKLPRIRTSFDYDENLVLILNSIGQLITRLAIKFQDIVDRGEVRDYAHLARLGFVTRARLTQIMNPLLLAPDIQEQLLPPARRTTTISERHLSEIVNSPDWVDQRKAWTTLQNIQ